MSEAEEALEDHETPVLKHRLIASDRLSHCPHVFLHGTHDVGLAAPCMVQRTTTLPWGLYSFCLPESSWSSTRNSLSAALRVCGTALRTWTPLSHSVPCASFVWSVYALFAMTRAQVKGDMRRSHELHAWNFILNPLL